MAHSNTPCQSDYVLLLSWTVQHDSVCAKLKGVTRYKHSYFLKAFWQKKWIRTRACGVKRKDKRLHETYLELEERWSKASGHTLLSKKKSSVLLWHISGKILEMLYIHQLILPSVSCQSKGKGKGCHQPLQASKGPSRKIHRWKNLQPQKQKPAQVANRPRNE